MLTPVTLLSVELDEDLFQKKGCAFMLLCLKDALIILFEKQDHLTTLGQGYFSLSLEVELCWVLFFKENLFDGHLLFWVHADQPIGMEGLIVHDYRVNLLKILIPLDWLKGSLQRLFHLDDYFDRNVIIFYSFSLVSKIVYSSGFSHFLLR